jgi:hypothetical protein
MQERKARAKVDTEGSCCCKLPRTKDVDVVETSCAQASCRRSHGDEVGASCGCPAVDVVGSVSWSSGLRCQVFDQRMKAHQKAHKMEAPVILDMGIRHSEGTDDKKAPTVSPAYWRPDSGA